LRRIAYVRGDSGVGHNYAHIRTRTCTCGRYQAGENIHNDDKRGELQKKRRAGLDLNVSGTREIAAPTRITVLSPSMATRWTVDRWFGSKRSKNLENVAGRRACWVWKRRKKNNARSPTISWKKYFSDGISPQRAETRLFKFHRDTSLSLSIKLQTSRKIIE